MSKRTWCNSVAGSLLLADTAMRRGARVKSSKNPSCFPNLSLSDDATARMKIAACQGAKRLSRLGGPSGCCCLCQFATQLDDGFRKAALLDLTTQLAASWQPPH